MGKIYNFAALKNVIVQCKYLFSFTMLFTFSSGVIAQETQNSCPFVQDILAYTQNVIEVRSDSQDELSAKYGAISAYLYAQYAGLSEREQSALYQQIEEMGLDDASALSGAYRIFTAPDADVVATINEVLAKEISSGDSENFTVPRAALLRGQGRYILKLQQTRELFVEALGQPRFLSYIVVDQPLEMRQTLASAFERLGMISHAIAILQTMPTLEPLLDIFQRNKNLENFDNEIYLGTGGYSTGLEFAIMHNYASDYQKLIIPQDHLYQEPSIPNLIMGELQFRLIQVLAILYNRTNKLDVLGDFAIMASDAIRSQGPDPNQEPFLTLAAFLEYFSEKDPDILNDLGRLHQPYLQYESMLALAQDQAAAFGFALFIQDQGALPQQPPFLKGDFDFVAWENIAKVIKQGDATGIEEKFRQNPRIVAELLFATNQHSQLAALLKNQHAALNLSGLSEVFAVRLDMRCKGYLNPPNSTMRWNIPMFRFGE